MVANHGVIKPTPMVKLTDSQGSQFCLLPAQGGQQFGDLRL